MSWRDEPATVGEVYDVLLESAEATKVATAKVEAAWAHNGLTRQLLQYAGAVQVSLFEEAAKKLKERHGG